MATRRIKEITNTATTFASDDFIALDGTTQGTRKMDKDDLIAEVSAGVSGDYLEEANNLSDVASLDTSKLNMEIPDVGTAPNEVPLSGQLGTMAFQDASGVSVSELQVESTTGTATTQALTVTDGSSTNFVVQEDGRTGINNSSPGTNANVSADDLVVGNGGEHGITIYSGSANNGRLFFSDGTGTDSYRGIIRYDHGSNAMVFGTNSSDRVTIDTSGLVGVNNTSPSSYNSNANNLVVGTGSGSEGLTIATGSGAGEQAKIFFANGATPSGTAAYQGYINFEPATNTMLFGTAGTQRAVIDSSGRLGLATSSPSTNSHVEADDLVIGDGSLTYHGLSIVTNSSGQGSLMFSDGTGVNAYRGIVRYNHTADALELWQASAKRWEIGSTGNLTPAAGLGIDFGAVASGTGTVTPTTGGLLDDFETGTWSPVIAPNTGSFATATTYVYFAKYTKVGNLVTANCYIRTDGTLDTTGGSGAVQIQGLPFTSPSANDFVSVNVGYAFNWSAAPAGGYVSANTNKILLTNRISSITGNLIAGSVSDLSTAGGAKNEIMLSVTYQTT